MGRPRIKIIDDSQKEVKKETTKQVKRAKSETDKNSVILSETKNLPTSEDPSLIVQDDKNDGKDRHVAPQSETPRDDKEKKPQKPGKAKPRSKKYQEIVKDLDRTKTYPLDGAVDMTKKLSYAKFNATLEAHINTAQTGIRGLVSLPYLSGKKLRILVFGPSPAPKLPGVVFGSDSTIEDVSQGKVDFDLIVTTPEWMSKLAKVAKILGPKGLIPNPKNGTITNDLKKTVESFQAGKTEYEHSSKLLYKRSLKTSFESKAYKLVYKTEPKAPIIHIALGKLSQPNEELIANIKTLLQTLGKSRVKKLTLSPTMGPSVKVDLASL